MSNVVTLKVPLILMMYDQEKLDTCLDEVKEFFLSSPRAREIFTEKCEGINFMIEDITPTEITQDIPAFQPILVDLIVDDDSEIDPVFFEVDDMGRGWVDGIVEGFIQKAKLVLEVNHEG